MGIAEHVTPARLDRFFVKQDNYYQVKKELREMCLFSSHSLIKDPRSRAWT
jgi:two-component system CheB/CheR fusion protein